MLITLRDSEDARLNDMLNLEDLFTRVFFARTKNYTASRHDLDMDSCRFMDGLLEVVYCTSIS